jgi:hypothetical protein
LDREIVVRACPYRQHIDHAGPAFGAMGVAPSRYRSAVIRKIARLGIDRWGIRKRYTSMDADTPAYFLIRAG